MGWTNQSANPNSCCCPEDLFPVPAACSLQPHLVSPQFRRLSQLPLGSLPCSSLIPLEVASVSFSCSSWRSTPILKHVIGGSRFTVTCHLMIHFYMITWVFHFQLRCWRGKSFFFSWLTPPITFPCFDGNRNLALFPGQLGILRGKSKFIGAHVDLWIQERGLTLGTPIAMMVRNQVRVWW